MGTFLTDLHIHNVRNLSSVRLNACPHFNLFFGQNGSGKTSVLEAIYLLSTGHSFRTREISPLIATGKPSLTIFARTSSNETVSIQKTNSGPTTVNINNQPCSSNSILTLFLPCQVFYQDIFQIIDAGPAVRRSLIDWGLFHVKQSYHSLWKDYRRVLKQRNALLRQKGSQQQCAPWDKMMVDLACELDKLRSEYFANWRSAFQSFLRQLTDIPCSIDYYKGWDKKGSGKDLAIILQDQFAIDSQRQYTHSGPHQADIFFDCEALNAKKYLSRGQQKIILIALKLSQAQLLSRPCLYLFDDITAELDTPHLDRLMACLMEVPGQFFLTTVDPNKLPVLLYHDKLHTFKLEAGKLSSVSRETY